MLNDLHQESSLFLKGVRVDTESMTLIDCPHCHHPHLTSTSDVLSLATIEGVVLGEVRCVVTDQVVIHDFTNGRTVMAAPSGFPAGARTLEAA